MHEKANISMFSFFIVINYGMVMFNILPFVCW